MKILILILKTVVLVLSIALIGYLVYLGIQLKNCLGF